MISRTKIFRICTTFVVLAALGSAPLFAAAFQPPQTAREKINLDLNWKFKKNDQSGAQAPTYNDDSWTTIHLPHSFQQVSVAGDNVDRGLGWYRHYLRRPIPAESCGAGGWPSMNRHCMSEPGRLTGHSS